MVVKAKNKIDKLKDKLLQLSEREVVHLKKIDWENERKKSNVTLKSFMIWLSKNCSAKLYKHINPTNNELTPKETVVVIKQSAGELSDLNSKINDEWVKHDAFDGLFISKSEGAVLKFRNLISCYCRYLIDERAVAWRSGLLGKIEGFEELLGWLEKKEGEK